MTISNIDGQVKGAVGGDVVVQASDVAKQGGATARDNGYDALESGLRFWPQLYYARSTHTVALAQWQ